MVEHHTLNGGLQVVLEPRPGSAPVAALELWIRTGGAQDPPGRAGLAHLLEHLVFRGTARRTGAAIEAAIELCGGELNAWTSLDQTVLRAVLPSRFVTRGINVLAELALEPRLESTALERERGVVLAELRQGAESPGHRNIADLMALAYGSHPYGRPVIGTNRSVAAVRLAEVRRFHHRHYVPANMTLVAVGDFQTQVVLAAAARRFCWSQPAPEAPLPRLCQPRRPRLSVRATTGTTHVSLGFHIPPACHEDVVQLELAAEILGGRMGPSTWRGPDVTSWEAQVFSPTGPGLFIVSATTTDRSPVALTRALLNQIEALLRSGPSRSELEQARQVLQAQATLQGQTPELRASCLGQWHAADPTQPAPEVVRWGHLAIATTHSVRAAIQRHLDPRRVSVAALGPDHQVARAAQRIRTATEARGRRAVPARGNRERLTRVVLGNGARLVVLADETQPVAAIRAAWQGGQRIEGNRTRGASNLLASLLTRGTQRQDRDSLQAACEALPGDIEGCFGENSLGLKMEVLARSWEPGLELLADCALHSSFAPDQVEEARQEALATLTASEADAGAAAMARFRRVRYGNQPYGGSLFGATEAVTALTRRGIVRHFQQHYPPSRCVVAVVGDVEAREVAAWFERRFGGTPTRVAARVARQRALPPLPRPSGPRLLLGRHDANIAHLVVGFPGTTKQSSDRFGLELLAALLGERGRLYAQLRQRHGLAYHIDQIVFHGLDPGHVAFYVACSAEALCEVLARTLQQFDLIRSSSVSTRELERTRRFLLGRHERSLQHATTLAQSFCYDELHGCGYRCHLAQGQALARVTPRQLGKLARQYFAPQQMAVGLSLPDHSSCDAIADRLTTLL